MNAALVKIIIFLLGLNQSAAFSSSIASKSNRITRRSCLPILCSKSGNPDFESTASPDNRSKMFTLLVVMRFQSEKAKTVWCESLKTLGTYVLEQEPNTLQYLFSESVEDPMVVTIFETYKTKSDFDDVHMKSEAFLEHVSRMKPYDDEIKTESFITGNTVADFGYLTK